MQIYNNDNANVTIMNMHLDLSLICSEAGTTSRASVSVELHIPTAVTTGRNERRHELSEVACRHAVTSAAVAVMPTAINRTS